MSATPPCGDGVDSAERARIAPRDDLRSLEGYHSPQIDVSVRLNTNESPFSPSPEFVEAWIERLRGLELNRYPDREATELRSALGAAIGQAPDRLFCANGSNEVLQCLLLAYGGSGRRAVVFEPTYALHRHIARITGTEVVTAERDADFRVGADAVERALAQHEPSIVLICSPNNPTGTAESIDVLAAAADAAERHGALLIVDEAYGEFAPRSVLEILGRDAPVAVVRTYSKVWSLAALRLGYCVAPDWLVGELEKVLLPYSLDAPTQLAGVIALDHREAMQRRVDELVGERDRVVAAMQAIPGLEPFPSAANFVLVRVGGDSRVLWERLLAGGVLVRDFSKWPRVEGCLRITIGTREQNDAMLSALQVAMQEVTS